MQAVQLDDPFSPCLCAATLIAPACAPQALEGTAEVAAVPVARLADLLLQPSPMQGKSERAKSGVNVLAPTYPALLRWHPFIPPESKREPPGHTVVLQRRVVPTTSPRSEFLKELMTAGPRPERLRGLACQSMAYDIPQSFRSHYALWLTFLATRRSTSHLHGMSAWRALPLVAILVMMARHTRRQWGL